MTCFARELFYSQNILLYLLSDLDYETNVYYITLYILSLACFQFIKTEVGGQDFDDGYELDLGSTEVIDNVLQNGIFSIMLLIQIVISKCSLKF